jgi:transposase-like protein
MPERKQPIRAVFCRRAMMRIRADGRKYRSEEEKAEIVKRFEKSGQNQEQFCLAEGIAKSSLYKWRQHLGLEPKRGANRFVEVVAEEEELKEGVAGTIELELPHGIILRVRS